MMIFLNENDRPEQVYAELVARGEVVAAFEDCRFVRWQTKEEVEGSKLSGPKTFDERLKQAKAQRLTARVMPKPAWMTGAKQSQFTAR